MRNTEVVLGIDIGGTNCAFGLVEGTGKILFKDSVPTQSEQPAAKLISRILYSINSWISGNKDKQIIIRGVGVGAPNGNYYNGYIENPPNLK